MDTQKWQGMSWPQKMGNIGSEIARARMWEERGNDAEARQSFERVLEMLHASVGNAETNLLREIVANKIQGTAQYRVSAKELEEYCLPFAFLARKHV